MTRVKITSLMKRRNSNRADAFGPCTIFPRPPSDGNPQPWCTVTWKWSLVIYCQHLVPGRYRSEVWRMPRGRTRLMVRRTCGSTPASGLLRGWFWAGVLYSSPESWATKLLSHTGVTLIMHFILSFPFAYLLFSLFPHSYFPGSSPQLITWM